MSGWWITGRRARLRASEADRAIIAERLYQATLEGRLLAEELDERLGVALSARTYGELDPLVADLPGSRPLSLRDGRRLMPPSAVLALVILLAALVVAAWQRW